jgi:hypothetical protein
LKGTSVEEQAKENDVERDVVTGLSSAGEVLGHGGSSRSLEADLEARERLAARLVGGGALVLLLSLVVGLAWYLLARYAASGAAVAISQIDVPTSVREMLATVGGSVDPKLATIVSDFQRWAGGYVGRTVAVLVFLIAGMLAAVRQSVSAMIPGLVMAMSLALAPYVLSEILGGLSGTGQGTDVVAVFEQDHDLARFNAALGEARVPGPAKSYLLAQAMALHGDGPDTRPGTEFYRQVSNTLEKDKPDDLVGASGGVRAYLERAAFGRAVSVQAREFEDRFATARRLSDHGVAWLIGIGVAVAFGVLLVAMGMTVTTNVRRVRRVMEVAADVDLAGHEVPDFTQDGSRHIEHMVQMLEKGRA